MSHEWKEWPIQIRKKEEFPNGLKRINNCPEILYYRGNWDENIFASTAVIVGSRKMTRYGREVIAKILPDLIKAGMTIVSGFMYGVDSEAHRQTIELGGKTAAVLGMGLDRLSPPENDGLYTKILETGGVVISEYEANIQGSLWTFPQRNRIVAGLSTKGIIVIEAGMKSGSLITARLGREFGKIVYAVPGPLTSSVSEGTNWLLKENQAKILTDVAEITNIVAEQTQLFAANIKTEESRLIEALGREAMTIDEIALTLRKPVAAVSILISNMSLKNLVTEENGKIYLNRF